MPSWIDMQRESIAEVLDQLLVSYDLQHPKSNKDMFSHSRSKVTSMSDVLLYSVEQSDDPEIDDIAGGLPLISANSTNTTLFCPERIAVVLEGNRVIELPTLAYAFVLLFALIFTLHRSYPKDLANTFDFTQKVLMGLDEGNLRPRVLSLKNNLLAVY
ncbi:hypothetical protein NQZ68_016036 [Dissostichus eleginoides]|nr:hypothetical protein NQZ68_016036 [Dissostichus eleginoides]